MTTSGTWSRGYWSNRRLLDTDYGVSLLPEAFQAVIFPFRCGEDVDDDVSVVEEDPAGPSRAFTVEHGDVGVLEPRFNLLSEGLGVAGGEGAHNHEVVGKAADCGNIQEQDVGSLPL